jgi:hypothetical protein
VSSFTNPTPNTQSKMPKTASSSKTSSRTTPYQTRSKTRANNNKLDFGYATWSTGVTYDGWAKVADGPKPSPQPHGHGVMSFPNSKEHGFSFGDNTMEAGGKREFDGEFKDGQFVNGTMTWDWGWKYVGEMKGECGDYLPERHGTGSMTWDSYGSWDGIGHTWNRTYSGEWKDDQPTDEGTWSVDDGREILYLLGNSMMCWKNGDTYGDTYNGEVRNGLRHGMGTFNAASDSDHVGTYEGKWENDVRHGHGTLTLNDGSGFTGEWQHDVPIDGTWFRK